ncbi:hypothetical protein VTO73DRAFT_1835 [Trametes versicolor]
MSGPSQSTHASAAPNAPFPRVTARPNVRPKRKEAPKISAAQRAEMQVAQNTKQAGLQEDLAHWYAEAEALAVRLSDKYGRKSEHYMTLMFSGGHKITAERKPNAYNAWSHHLAKSVNEGELYYCPREWYLIF